MFFREAIVHGFSKKLENSLFLLLRQNRQRKKNVFDNILLSKFAFLGYKKINSQKSAQNWHFSKWVIVHGSSKEIRKFFVFS